ncbi:hypothetical protein [Sphingobium algorifonticola]|uniref:LPXTG cell wall anchor domain-containing protein n=1 Tax=Sphingobium algorifonticola TaxID=2008318 RepID=A0A437J7D6_9SPHN|nr:hypothetical protein [Sphingobium algorifonticola]RVT41082.1 hypothetical protein ENE74_11645 [Sphingobium algorifonticola]
MRKHITVRPARAAIAAVLALGSTPLLAQVAAPSAPPPVAATQPAAPAVNAAPPPVASTAPDVAAPILKPQSPVVQPLPEAPPVVAAPIAEAAPPAPVRREILRAERAAPTDAPAAADAAPVAATTAAPAAATPSAVSTSAVPAPVESTPAALPASNAVPADPADNSALEWGLMGGGIVLLGGAALLATMRRRRLRADSDPVIHRASVQHGVREEPVIESAITTDRVPSPVAVAPTPVAARRSTASPVVGHQHADLEAMVAAAPTADNPFRTRKNRLRRAHFLMRNGGMAVTQPTTVTPVNAVPQTVPRHAPVYDFGGNMGQRRGWRPATT